MKYLKRVIFCSLVTNLNSFLTMNVTYFPDFKFFVDGVTVFLFLGTFLFSFIDILVLKLFSIKARSKIYESLKFIFYLVIIRQNVGALEVLLTSPIEFWEIDILALDLIYYAAHLIPFVFITYYFWKYRVEIALGLFSTQIMMYGVDSLINTEGTDLLSEFMKNYLGFEYVSNFMKVVVLLSFLAIFLGVTIFLRKQGVYDYRSRKEQWNEKANKGYYARPLLQINNGRGD